MCNVYKIWAYFPLMSTQIPSCRWYLLLKHPEYCIFTNDICWVYQFQGKVTSLLYNTICLLCLNKLDLFHASFLVHSQWNLLSPYTMKSLAYIVQGYLVGQGVLPYPIDISPHKRYIFMYFNKCSVSFIGLLCIVLGRDTYSDFEVAIAD